VFYLEDSKLDITKAQIYNTYAANGGIIYKLGKEDVDIKSSIITATQVKLSGGIAYFVQQNSFISSEIFTFTISSPLA
jgi:hypothetical protein